MYHQDEQLSTAFITNEKREIQNHYQYDAFGNGICQEEGIFNRIRYIGQQYDGVTGQYYLRSRYYNPILGRFLQEDEYQGDGLNLYAYCGNNPVRYYDPSGYSKKKKTVNRTICEFETINGDAGQEVIRKFVENQDELLKIAEQEAGGSLDDWISDEENQWVSPDKTTKIEWNPEGHSNTNEGPHVTIRKINSKGGYSVVDKYFIRGWEKFKRSYGKQ